MVRPNQKREALVTAQVLLQTPLIQPALVTLMVLQRIPSLQNNLKTSDHMSPVVLSIREPQMTLRHISRAIPMSHGHIIIQAQPVRYPCPVEARRTPRGVGTHSVVASTAPNLVTHHRSILSMRPGRVTVTASVMAQPLLWKAKSQV